MKKIILLLIFSTVFAESHSPQKNNIWSVNIWGHVQKPGLVSLDIKNEKFDLIYLLSKAGGPLPDAKLNKVKIISEDNKVEIINLKEIMESGDYTQLPQISSNYTIIIEPKFIYNLKSNNSLIHTFLYITTIGLQLTANK